MSYLSELQTEFEKFKQEKYEVPYFYRMESTNQQLFYLGISHTYDINNSQILQIKECWKLFLASKPTKPLLLTEGGVRDVSMYNDEKEVIRESGEMGLLTFLAKRENIPLETPEPTDAEWFSGLEKEFGHNAAAYYDFVRICHQWNTRGGTKDFTNYINSFLATNGENLDRMKIVHKKLFKNVFNPSDDEFFKIILNPSSHFSIINRISYFDDAGYRDNLILKNILKYWSEGRSLFILYGLQHAVIQENILKNYVKSHEDRRQLVDRVEGNFFNVM